MINKLRRASSSFGSKKNLGTGDGMPDDGYAASAKYMTVKDVGKMVKSSKKRIVWMIGLCSDDVKIELVDSIMSGKKVIYANGDMVNCQPYSDAQGSVFQFSIGQFKMEVHIDNSRGDGAHGHYKLFINGVEFNKLRKGNVFERGSAPPPPPPGMMKEKLEKQERERQRRAYSGEDREEEEDGGGEEEEEDDDEYEEYEEGGGEGQAGGGDGAKKGAHTLDTGEGDLLFVGSTGGGGATGGGGGTGNSGGGDAFGGGGGGGGGGDFDLLGEAFGPGEVGVGARSAPTLAGKAAATAAAPAAAAPAASDAAFNPFAAFEDSSGGGGGGGGGGGRGGDGFDAFNPQPSGGMSASGVVTSPISYPPQQQQQQQAPVDKAAQIRQAMAMMQMGGGQQTPSPGVMSPYAQPQPAFHASPMVAMPMQPQQQQQPNMMMGGGMGGGMMMQGGGGMMQQQQQQSAMGGFMGMAAQQQPPQQQQQSLRPPPQQQQQQQQQPAPAVDASNPFAMFE